MQRISKGKKMNKATIIGTGVAYLNYRRAKKRYEKAIDAYNEALLNKAAWEKSILAAIETYEEQKYEEFDKVASNELDENGDVYDEYSKEKDLMILPILYVSYLDHMFKYKTQFPGGGIETRTKRSPDTQLIVIVKNMSRDRTYYIGDYTITARCFGHIVAQDTMPEALNEKRVDVVDGSFLGGKMGNKFVEIKPGQMKILCNWEYVNAYDKIWDPLWNRLMEVYGFHGYPKDNTVLKPVPKTAPDKQPLNVNMDIQYIDSKNGDVRRGLWDSLSGVVCYVTSEGKTDKQREQEAEYFGKSAPLSPEEYMNLYGKENI